MMDDVNLDRVKALTKSESCKFKKRPAVQESFFTWTQTIATACQRRLCAVTSRLSNAGGDGGSRLRSP